ncbi:cohesin complex subunit [Entomophthora muscae]|uniref:Cohesin complex subunit n=1 Tax=Entomophthora muscae TaxID=34485 RepID=A0ACC2S1C1_9FUNG|nr:cohesin complex subunit [Entomophthora muscae]
MSIKKASNSKRPSAAKGRAATPTKKPQASANKTKAAAQPAKKRKVLATVEEAGGSRSSSRKEMLCGPADDTSLYNEIMDEQAAMQMTVKEWISSYQETPIEAIYQLLAAIVKISGSPIVISREAIQQESPFNLVFEELQEGVKENAEVPYLSKNKEGRLSKKRILEFFRGLMKHGLHDIFSDQTLVGFFKMWFTAMSSSPFRPFRQVGASLSFKFMTILCEACRELEAEQEISLQQSSNRKPKKGATKKKPQLSSQELGSQINLLSTTLGNMFETIFVKRCTDTEPSIRVESLKEFGSWVLKYPTLFLDDKHLKYLNWRLTDKTSSVRLEAINAIMVLCNDDNSVSRLRLFINSARARLLDMATKDIELSIRCQAIKLLLVVNKRGLLELDDKNRILDLLFSKDEKMRIAAAPFVEYILEQELIPEKAKELKLKVETLSPSERRKLGLKSLIGLLAQNCAEEASEPSTLRTPLLEFSHGFILASRPSIGLGPVSLAVRALWKEVYYVQDWESLLDLATQDNSARTKKTKIQLTATEEPYLLEMIEACFKMLSEEHAPEPSKKSTAPSAYTLLRTRLVQDILPIKDILSRHGDNEQLIVPILRALQAVLDGELFLEADKMKAYVDLAQAISKIFNTHQSALVLFQAASTLKALGRFKSGAPHEFTQLSESIVDNLVNAITSFQDDFEEMLMPMHRLHGLLSVTSWGVGVILDDEYGPFTTGLWDVIDKANVVAELKVAVASLGILYRSLLWGCLDLSDTSLGKVVRLRDKLIHTCLSLMRTNADSADDSVRGAQVMAFRIINEVCWLNQRTPLLKARPPLPAISVVEEASVQFVGISLAWWQQEDQDDSGLKYYHNQVVTTFIASVINRVFNLGSSVEIVARFGTLGPICDEAVRLLFNHGIKPRLKAASDGEAVRLVFRSVSDALAEALKRQANSEPLNSQDNAANLAKLVASSLRTVGGNIARISKAIALFHQTTVWTAIQNIKIDPSNKTEEKVSMQSFRILCLLLKGLIVPLHARDLLRQVMEASQEISPPSNSTEWTPYYNYLKTLEEIQPAKETQPAPEESAKRPLEPETE